MNTHYAEYTDIIPKGYCVKQLTTPVIYNNQKYYGWGLYPLNNKNHKQVVYDPISQKIQSNNAIASLSRQLADQQRLIANLTIQIAKLKGGK